jgi:hypothetical protein
MVYYWVPILLFCTGFVDGFQMATYFQTILIDAPPEQVFSVITAFQEICSRSPTIIESKILTPPPIGLGTQTQITLDLKTGRTETWIEEVCGWRPPCYYAYRSVKGKIVMEGRYFIDKEGNTNGSQVTFIETFENTPRDDKIEESVKKSLQKLKIQIENR